MLRLHLLGSLKRACFRCRMTVCNGLHMHALGLLPEARLRKLLQYPNAFLRENPNKKVSPSIIGMMLSLDSWRLYRLVIPYHRQSDVEPAKANLIRLYPA